MPAGYGQQGGALPQGQPQYAPQGALYAPQGQPPPSYGSSYAPN
jgi:hypothetical protein